MEKEKIYTLVTVHYVGDISGLDGISTNIYKEKEVAILDAKSNADADFYIGGDREKSAFFEYDENTHLSICAMLGERVQIYANRIERNHAKSVTWRLVFEKEIK